MKYNFVFAYLKLSEIDLFLNRKLFLIFVSKINKNKKPIFEENVNCKL